MKQYKELTTLRTILITLLMLIIGGTLLYLSENIPIQWKLQWLQTLLRDFGSLITVSVAITVIWELISKRALLRELLSVTKLVDEIEETGLLGISAKWQGKVDWNTLFQSCKCVDLFIMYGRTWRNTYREQLIGYLKRPNIQLRIILPDPENEIIINELGQRIGVERVEINKRIIEAKEEFEKLFRENHDPSGKLEIWFASVAPVFSYYLFDGVAIFTLYGHSIEKVEVPTFTVRKSGSLYNFLEKDFNELIGGDMSRARRIM